MRLPPIAHRYGWTPDLPDPRDRPFGLRAPRPLASLPARTDLRAQMPPVYDQGTLGSCTANATGALLAFHLRSRRGFALWKPSRLFIYYNERARERTVAIDAGAQIRTGIKTLAQEGCPPEPLWPYSDRIPGPFSKRPSPAAYARAKAQRAASYERLPRTALAMRSCLASGLPFAFGFTVFEGFESPDVAKTGTVPLPGPGQRPLGGHAVVAVGYDDATERFLVRNSWGALWGARGHCTLPYSYLLDEDLADDFWTVRAVT